MAGNEHIESTLPNGVPLILAPVTSGKSLLDSIEERGRFPSASVRWCTSSTYGEVTIGRAMATRSLWRVEALRL